MNQPDSNTVSNNAENTNYKTKMNQAASESHSTRKLSEGFNVAASPFNGIKLELAVFVVAVILLWAVVEVMTQNVLLQMLILLMFSCIAALWLVFRIRRLVKRQIQN